MALGGVEDTAESTFTPLVMGVARYQFASDGQTYQQDIDLNIPLDRSLPVKLANSPSAPGGAPDTNHARAWMDFGFEGVFGNLPRARGPGQVVVLDRMPALGGPLQGVDFTIEGGAYTGNGSACWRGAGAPCAVALARDVTTLGQQVELDMLGVPTITQPANFERPQNGLIAFDYPAVRDPDLFQVRIQDGFGRRYWEAFLPGSARSVRLPDFPDFSSLPPDQRPDPYQGGAWTMLIIGIEQPGLDVNNFTYRDLGLEQWSAYSLVFQGIQL